MEPADPLPLRRSHVLVAAVAAADAAPSVARRPAVTVCASAIPRRDSTRSPRRHMEHAAMVCPRRLHTAVTIVCRIAADHAVKNAYFLND